MSVCVCGHMCKRAYARGAAAADARKRARARTHTHTHTHTQVYEQVAARLTSGTKQNSKSSSLQRTTRRDG